MKKKIKFLAAALAVAGIVTAGAAALAAAGGTNDPLITLSYLTQVFTPQVEARVDEIVAANEEALKAEVEASIAAWEEELKSLEIGETNSSVFTVVTLSRGQTLIGEIGCEIMLRVGTAVCVSDEDPGLIDSTGAAILYNGGELVKNHMYMVTIETRGVLATADTVKVLVRGPYTIQDAETAQDTE